MSRLSDVLLQGTHAARPAAAAGNTSYYYWESDTQTLFQSTGSAWVQLAPAVGAPSFSGEASATDFKATGLSGATAASRYIGATTSGAPASGTFATGDFCIDQSAQVWICTAAGTPGTWAKVAGSGGTVTSVALSVPSDLSVSGSPITGAGTLAVTANNQSANLVKAGPSTGAAAAPTFRALVSADLPSAPTVSGEVTASDFKASGLTGATAATRYVGGTTTGHPTTGTFAVGDYVVTQDASVWVCTTAGTPGTWTQIAGGGAASPLTTKGDLYTHSTVDARLPVGTDGYALVADSTQSTGLAYKAWGAVQPNTKVQLDYWASTDLANPLTLSATTWTDIGTNQTFTVDDASSTVEIALVAGMGVGGVNASNYAARLLVDSAGTPITKMVYGGAYTATASTFTSVGGGPVTLTGLAAGSHTVKVQVYATVSGTLVYCRPSTQPNIEFLNLRVLERKQSSSPPSSTPAPAVRAYNSANISIPDSTTTALTFDTNRIDQGTSTPQHSTSSNTSRLTCQQDGMYVITADVVFAGNATGIRVLDIRLNGATTIAETDQTSVSVAGGTVLNATTTYYLNVGDYVEATVYQSSGGALNVTHNGNFSPEFMMARVDSGGQGFVPIPMVKTANYTILNTDAMVVAGASSLTFTLPAASTRAPGMPLVVKNDNFTGTTIARAGSDTIDGATTYSLASAYASVTLVGDGSATWRAI